LFEPEPPTSCVQVFAGAQVYKFWPGVFAVLKNISPGLQVAGNVVPDFAGMVDAAFEKSTFLVCVRRSTKFWPFMDESSQSRLTNWYFFTKLKSFEKTRAPVHQAVGTEHRFLAQVWLAPVQGN
jgi:hypothetical protein